MDGGTYSEEKPTEDKVPLQIRQQESKLDSKKNSKPKLIHGDVENFEDDKPIKKAQIIKDAPLYGDVEDKLWEFDTPNPWTKIIFKQGASYPYFFHLKVRIPSLKDYQDWKEIIPNIDFDPRAGEIIIPSKDEPSALAVANLMVINLTGQMSLENILDNKLLQISINKSKSHEMVQSKLREQILDNLYGKPMTSNKPQFEGPNKTVESRQLDSMGTRKIEDGMQGRVNFQSEKFQDTFEHFASNSSNEGIDAFDGNDFSYL